MEFSRVDNILYYIVIYILHAVNMDILTAISKVLIAKSAHSFSWEKVTVNGPYSELWPCSLGQYWSHLILVPSFRLVIITIICERVCHTIRQKSTKVFSRGPTHTYKGSVSQSGLVTQALLCVPKAAGYKLLLVNEQRKHDQNDHQLKETIQQGMGIEIWHWG